MGPAAGPAPNRAAGPGLRPIPEGIPIAKPTGSVVERSTDRTERRIRVNSLDSGAGYP